MNIRNEIAADVAAIETLTYSAFDGHPHHAPGAKPTEHLIVNRLRESGGLALSLVAAEADRIVGHIAFSPVSVGGNAAGWYGLAPVSVLPERQGEGIGSLLVREGISRLQAAGAAGIVLLGEPGYYGRFGFKACAEMTLPGVPADYFLILPTPGGKPLPAGEVAFHPAFNS